MFTATPKPAFADIDDDGDLDLFIGNSLGQTRFFRNDGSAKSPDFNQEGQNKPFGITNVGSMASPELADIDADGDLDLFIGDLNGKPTSFATLLLQVQPHPLMSRGWR